MWSNARAHLEAGALEATWLITALIIEAAIAPQVTKGKNAMPAFLGRLNEPTLRVSAYVEEMAAKGWTDLFRSELIWIPRNQRPALCGFFGAAEPASLTLMRWRASKPQGRIFGDLAMSYSLGARHGHGGEPPASSSFRHTLLLDSKLP